ncbi:helix-turn-helix domain-containing protein [Chryseobacterium angstadtii]|nr:helix-turn-helix domain-containing protein [Chryseobacterium angstadtii]
MLRIKFPDKRKDCEVILAKTKLTDFDILHIESILFKKEKNDVRMKDKRHRSYDIDTICKILAYQKANELNNTQVAARYGLSRNTVASWKKKFLLN